ncbi:MAG: DUF4019 domain-containing protein [Thermodesulfobacteriota bacterium]
MTISKMLLAVMLGVFLVAQQTVPSFADPAKEEQAVAAAQAWLALVDQGKYEESWKEAASFFKKSITSSGWSSMVRSVRKQLGKCNSRTVKSKQYTTQVPGGPAGEYVIVEFSASFANKPTAVERVTPMLDKDGKWRVSGYFIVQ